MSLEGKFRLVCYLLIVNMSSFNRHQIVVASPSPKALNLHCFDVLPVVRIHQNMFLTLGLIIGDIIRSIVIIMYFSITSSVTC